MKLDLYRRHRSEYVAPKNPTLVRAGHASLGRMEEFARARRLRFAGRHHEIYLSDPRRVAPAKLRTILRRPVR